MSTVFMLAEETLTGGGGGGDRGDTIREVSVNLTGRVRLMATGAGRTVKSRVLVIECVVGVGAAVMSDNG